MFPNSLTPGHEKSEERHRQEICTAGRWMYEREFIVATEGNLSVRLADGRILTTPTSMNKGMLTPEDLIITNLEGQQLCGVRNASSELAMHLLFYRLRPDVQAICHAHPPTATGFAAAGRGLGMKLLPRMIAGLGQIPLVRYATPGTPELSDAIEPYVHGYDALLLANHGAVACGPDIATAFFRMEAIEHSAKITLAAETVDVRKGRSMREVENLIARRGRHSITLPPGRAGGAKAAD
jgi:L-fuculose-phosphate aldolase